MGLRFVVQSCLFLGWCCLTDDWCRGVLAGFIRGYSERTAVNPDRDAVVFQPVKEPIHQGFLAEEVVPLGVIEVGGDDGRFSTVAFLHELEEDIGLFGVERKVSEFVDHEQIVSRQGTQELGGASVR